jgi:hypothetical protein
MLLPYPLFVWVVAGLEAQLIGQAAAVAVAA